MKVRIIVLESHLNETFTSHEFRQREITAEPGVRVERDGQWVINAIEVLEDAQVMPVGISVNKMG